VRAFCIIFSREYRESVKATGKDRRKKNRREPDHVEKKIPLEGVDQLRLFGLEDENLRMVETLTHCRAMVRDGKLKLIGEREDVDKGVELCCQLIDMVQTRKEFDRTDVRRIYHEIGSENVDNNWRRLSTTIYLPGKKKTIHPRSEAQKQYIEDILNNDIVVSIGPAGTGKTYLAVAMAIDALNKKKVKRIILARPAVEAGENLGFLPGDLQEKVDPYLRPLHDALHDMLPSEKVNRAIESRVIEIAPLAYMRGRTLNEAFVILDEAQNTTPLQMKMFLTRLGMSSRAVITGDKTQIDLVRPEESGLLEIEEILKPIDGIAFVYFSDLDVVRHPLVQEIIKAYEAKMKK
jgi:phosphate starvation-inducible PhoH-like protein